MLLDLPTELVIQILSYLPVTDLASCRRTCRNVFNIVRDSVDLQYHTALLAASATDNPCSPLPLSTKLEQLRNGDKSWAVLKPAFTMTIPVKHNPSGIYDLTGGVYLLGNHNRRDLHYVRLPSHPDEQPEWSTIHVGRTIIDMGLCVYEHDLIAVVTTTPNLGPTLSHDIELLLFEFSTCKPHPQAKKHVIHVMNTPGEKPAIGIEVVGDNLVLILYYHRNDAKPDDKVFIFDWRTAVVKMSFAVPNDTYTGLIFLDEHTILLPNAHTNALDVYRIPSKPTLNTSPIMTLLLPRLAEGRTVGGISCRAEPNPIGASSSIQKKKEAKERAAAFSDDPHEEDMFPKRGYLANSEEAICIFALRIQSVQLGQFPFGHTFTFIVPRNTLLDAVHGCLTKQQSRDSTASAPVPVFPRFDEPTLQPFPRIAWADWGPGMTRWFNSDSIPTRWITTTSGQRCVLIADSAPDTGFPYVVLDFNPESVRRMKRWLKARKEREKARDMRERRESRERAMEEARQWVETTGAATPQGADDEDEDDEDMLLEDEPAEYHVGMVVVDVDDVPDVHPGELPSSWEGGAAGVGMSASTSTPAAGPSTSAVAEPSWTADPHPVADHVDLERTYSGESAQHVDDDSEGMEIDLDVDVDISAHHMPSPQLEPTSTPESPSSLRSWRASTHGDIDDVTPDPDNPLEGSDATAARRIWCVTTPETVEPADTFAEHVEGRLAYVACASARTYPFHGVLLDEERVIGIKTDFLDRIRQIEVHHFG